MTHRPEQQDAPGRHSVAFPTRWWYPACRSGDLGRRPLGITLMDTPFVLFRDRVGAPHALLDRCAHRNLPLSLGRVAGDGSIECCYHGWRYDGAGTCVAVPGLVEGPDAAAAARAVPSHAVAEHDGFVWVWGEPGGHPTRRPVSLPVLEGRGAGEVVFRYDLSSTLHAALENALDVPHTAFLHRGVFRGTATRELTAVRRWRDDGVEVQYLGEPVGFGWFQRPGSAGLTFDHWDRFVLPSVAQIEYRVPGWLHIVSTILHLPTSASTTRAWFVVRFWTRLPAWMVRPLVAVRGRRILRQDAFVLRHQTAQVRRFGGERYASTELDLMGNAMWRLLRRAERDEPVAEAGTEDEPVVLRV